MMNTLPQTTEMTKQAAVFFFAMVGYGRRSITQLHAFTERDQANDSAGLQAHTIDRRRP